MSNSNALPDKYRPTELDEVIGQDGAVSTLRNAITNNLSHAFMLSGPSGVGKTTLARIASSMLNAELVEIGAATHTGIDAMREVQTTAYYKPLDKDHRAIIIDEAHRLSKQAWDASLKIIEEPPSHVTWFLCTTEPSKIPLTIRNRCTELKLKSIAVDDLDWLLCAISEQEGMTVTPDVCKLCAVEADGSARKALINLSMCNGMTREEARTVLREQAAAEPVAKLCKLMMRGGAKWPEVIEVIADMPDDPEASRIGINNYLAAVLRNSKSDKDATYLLNMMEAFATPYHPGEQQAPLMRSIGRVLFG